MGYRAYVVKAGCVDEYTCGEYFNRLNCEVLELFYDNDIQFEDDFRRGRTKWTIKDGELYKLIALLEKSPNEENECFVDSGRREYTNQELADIFKEWVKQADEENGLIYIHWD